MIFAAIAAGIFLLDFIIKRQIDAKRELMDEELILNDKIILRKYYNKGAALNFLAKKPKLMCAIHTALMAVATTAFGFLLSQKNRSGQKLALSFLVGGGMNNLFDRITKHHVVDYFSFHVKWKKLRGIIFNISDLFIFLGAILALIFAQDGKK